MRHTWIIAPLGLAMLTTACGETTPQRATTGAAGGAVAGAVVGGPVGALVGAGVGAAGGAYRDKIDDKVDETADKIQENRGTSSQAQTQRGSAGANSASATGERLSNQEVRQIQTTLRDMGLYKGQIDGIYGRQTAAAVGEFQAQNNLPRTMALDTRTMQQLQNQTASAGNNAQQRQGQPQQAENPTATPAAPAPAPRAPAQPAPQP